MPYVLKHRETSELFACTLINAYDLPYHGVKFWLEREAAERERASFLSEQGVGLPSQWEVAELDENQLKMGNVKLNNNPARRVFLTEEGRIAAR